MIANHPDKHGGCKIKEALCQLLQEIKNDLKNLEPCSEKNYNQK
jgi:hypothetical protein